MKMISVLRRLDTQELEAIFIIIKFDSQQITFSHFTDSLDKFYKSKVRSDLEHIKENNSGKLVFYSKICKDFTFERYLCFDKSARCLITRLRISAHSLTSETGQYHKSKTPVDKRTYKFYNNKVKSETHVFVMM